MKGIKVHQIPLLMISSKSCMQFDFIRKKFRVCLTIFRGIILSKLASRMTQVLMLWFSVTSNFFLFNYMTTYITFTGSWSLWWSWGFGILERCLPNVDHGRREVNLSFAKGIWLIVLSLDYRWVIRPYSSCCMKPCWRSWRKDVPWVSRVTME